MMTHTDRSMKIGCLAYEHQHKYFRSHMLRKGILSTYFSTLHPYLWYNALHNRPKDYTYESSTKSLILLSAGLLNCSIAISLKDLSSTTNDSFIMLVYSRKYIKKSLTEASGRNVPVGTRCRQMYRKIQSKYHSEDKIKHMGISRGKNKVLHDKKQLDLWPSTNVTIQIGSCAIGSSPPIYCVKIRLRNYKINRINMKMM